MYVGIYLLADESDELSPVPGRACKAVSQEKPGNHKHTCSELTGVAGGGGALLV